MAAAVVPLDRLLGIVGAPEVVIESCTFNVDEVKQNSLYVALNGQTTQRELYSEQAVQQGASVVLFERTDVAYYSSGEVVFIHTPEVLSLLGRVLCVLYPHNAITLYGVTGTNGKTTVSWLLAGLLEASGIACGVVGTLGVGRCHQLKPNGMTTPEILTLHRLLHQFQTAGNNHVAMEVSAHAIAQKRSAGASFASKIFTNCGQDHLDYFDTLVRYHECKRKWLTDGKEHIAVVNIDDSVGQTIVADAALFGVPCVRYSLQDTDADCYASDIEEHPSGLRALIHYRQQTAALDLPFFGMFNLANTLAALTTLVAHGHDLQVLTRGAKTLTLPPGRMKTIALPNGQCAVIDYAHTADALAQVLRAVKHHTGSQLTLVFGCGGNRDKTKRPAMGKVASTHASALWVTSDNSRRESFEAIADDIAVGIEPTIHMQRVADRAKAIEQAMRYTLESPNRALVIAGKGHETTQETNGLSLPFNDESVLQDALACYRQAQL